MNSTRPIYRALLICISIVSLSGCILVPFFQAFKESGVTADDRMALLEPQAKRFFDSVMMGDKTRALTFVLPESRSELSKRIKGRSDEERVVESKFEEVAWAEDARQATITVKVRYYKVPYYIVETRLEEQQWEFTISDGWKLRNMTVING